jgi:lipoate-protein ligase B
MKRSLLPGDKVVNVDIASLKKTWLFLDLGMLGYRDAWSLQLRLLDARKSESLKNEVVLFLEHQPVFTLGKRGGLANLKVTDSFLASRAIPLIHVERGGDITYHGPGQLVVYPIIHLHSTGMGVLRLVEGLEEVMIRTLAEWGIKAGRDPRNRGAWVGKDKIGSIGIAVRRSVSFHGFALNVNTDLEPFTWVNPCGLQNVMITSMKQILAKVLSMDDVKAAAKEHLQNIFGITLLASRLEDILPHDVQGKASLLPLSNTPEPPFPSGGQGGFTG